MPVNVFCKINSILKIKQTVRRTFEMIHVLGARELSRVKLPEGQYRL
jgi:hypothetical protein